MLSRLTTLPTPVLHHLGDRQFEVAHKLMAVACEGGLAFGFDLSAYRRYFPRKAEILLSYLNEAKRRGAMKKELMHA